MASPVNQQLPSPLESTLSELGYGAGSEGYPSPSAMGRSDEEEDGSDEGDMIGEGQASEVWLTWVEVRVDTVLEQEEHVEAQE